jgi:hypothetical protein
VDRAWWAAFDGGRRVLVGSESETHERGDGRRGRVQKWRRFTYVSPCLRSRAIGMSQRLYVQDGSYYVTSLEDVGKWHEPTRIPSHSFGRIYVSITTMRSSFSQQGCHSLNMCMLIQKRTSEFLDESDWRDTNMVSKKPAWAGAGKGRSGAACERGRRSGASGAERRGRREMTDERWEELQLCQKFIKVVFAKCRPHHLNRAGGSRLIYLKQITRVGRSIDWFMRIFWIEEQVVDVYVSSENNEYGSIDIHNHTHRLLKSTGTVGQIECQNIGFWNGVYNLSSLSDRAYNSPFWNSPPVNFIREEQTWYTVPYALSEGQGFGVYGTSAPFTFSFLKISKPHT